MRLKLITSALLLFGIVLLIGWPFAVGSRPAANPDSRLSAASLSRLSVERQAKAREARRELASWTVRYAIYFLVTLVVFASTAISAILLARQTREEFRAEASENLRDLIDGTLEDHARRRDS